ncbi:hypothetical protein [Hyalangium sp.]|uniref:hypothetical protein n=1 Tax=Hyalangium sp. TaxID=2028555 RepID=UPI002D6E9B81|nr:hypothetical protein [Hyalangium sp.]HYI02327.1 hypothetical protein [Hyalangium sp.]
MSLLKKLLGGTGELKGRVTLLNRRASVDYLVLVEAFPVDEGAPPPFKGEPPEKLREKKRLVTCPPQSLEFELKLPAGHYQLFTALMPVVIDGTHMEVDPSQRFSTWPMPRALAVESGQTRHVNLKIDLTDAGTQAWKIGESAPPPAEPAEEEDAPMEGSEMPLFQRLPPRLKARFGQAIELQQAGHHAQAVPAFDGVLVEVAPSLGNSMDLKELSLLTQTCKAKSLMALGRPAEALEALRDPPKGLQTEDLTAFIDYMYTQTDAHGRLGKLENMVTAMGRTLDLCVKGEAAGPFHKTVQLGLYWMREKSNPQGVLNLAKTLRQRPDVARIPVISLLVDDFCWEAFHALGQLRDCREIASEALQQLRAMEAPEDSETVQRWRVRFQQTAQ